MPGRRSSRSPRFFPGKCVGGTRATHTSRTNPRVKPSTSWSLKEAVLVSRVFPGRLNQVWANSFGHVKPWRPKFGQRPLDSRDPGPPSLGKNRWTRGTLTGQDWAKVVGSVGPWGPEFWAKAVALVEPWWAEFGQRPLDPWDLAARVWARAVGFVRPRRPEFGQRPLDSRDFGPRQKPLWDLGGSSLAKRRWVFRSTAAQAWAKAFGLVGPRRPEFGQTPWALGHLASSFHTSVSCSCHIVL